MRAETIICDSCGVVKKETNHWFTMEMGQALVIRPSHMPVTPGTDRTILDICGSACVIKKVSEYLASK